MSISLVYNKTLLNAIRVAGKITYDDLREKFSHMAKVTLDNNLDILVELGYVIQKDDTYIYIEK